MADGLLGRWAVFSSSRPWVCIFIVACLSICAMSSILVFGVEQTFDVSQFEPDNEVVSAMDDISEYFGDTALVSVLVEFERDEENGTLTKDHFLQVLETEKAIFEDPAINQYLLYPDDASRSIYSPMSIISLIVMNVVTSDDFPFPVGWEGWGLEMVQDRNGTTGEPLFDPDTGDPVMVPAQSYDNMIKVLDNATSILPLDTIIWMVMDESYDLPDEYRDQLRSLLSDDFQYESPDTVNASSGLIMVMYEKDGDAGPVDREIIEDKVSGHMITNDSSITMTVVGWGSVNRAISDSAMENLEVLFPIAILLIFIIMYAFLRNLRDVLVSLLCIGLAILWVYGYAALMGDVLTPLSLTAPFLIMGIGVDFSIHLIIRYRSERKGGLDHAEGTIRMMRIVGQALVLSTVTTCLAYLSNVTSDMEGMIQFGLMNAAGILSTFFIVTMLVPAYLSLKKEKVPKVPRREKVRKLRKTRLPGVFSKYSTGIIVMVTVSTLVLGTAAVNVGMDFDVYQFLPSDSELTEKVNTVSDSFYSSGLSELNVLVEADADDPEVLSALQCGLENMGGVDNVVKMGACASTGSIFDVLLDWAVLDSSEDVRFNSSFQSLYLQYFTVDGTCSHFNGNATQEELEGMYSVLRSIDLGAMDLDQYVSVREDGTPMMLVTVTIMDGLTESDVWALEGDLRTALLDLEGLSTNLIITGDIIVSYEIVEGMRDAQLYSVAVTLCSALIILTLISYVRHRSFIMGVLTLLPTSITIVWIWGFSYLLGVTLNPLTMTVAAITVGVGVDYSIHMTSRFQDLLDEGKSLDEALDDTVTHTGRGVLAGALTTSAGFGILYFFTMKPISEFGLMAMSSVFLTVIITLVFLPSVLSVWAKFRA